MIGDRPIHGRISVDKYLDVRYGDETIFEYFGKDAYKAFSNFIHEDDLAQFRELFENAGTDWAGMSIKLRRYDGVYRDGYIGIKKKDRIVNGIQLWDISLYDMSLLVDEYHDVLCLKESYKALIEAEGMNYFRYTHDTGIISFCRMVNKKELVLFSMDINEWESKAVLLGHVAVEDIAVLEQFCTYVRSGKNEISVDMKMDREFGEGDLKLCHIKASVILRDKKPVYTVGRVAIKSEIDYSDTMSAVVDSLTGVFNKKTITDRAKKIIAEYDGNTALFILDIDNFKNANDNFGHMFGDKVLAKVANVILEVVGTNGTSGRFGGDEFMGIITGFANSDELKAKMRSLRSRIEYLFADVPNLNVTCSIGVCEKQECAKTYDEIFGCADKCLYLAKNKGKNRYIIYNRELHGSLSVDDGRITELKNATHNKKEYDIINDAMLILYKEGYAGIEKVLHKFTTELVFDRATVYYGEGFKRLFYCESVDSKYDYAFFAENPEYIKQFNDSGMVTFSNIYRFEEMDKDMYIKFEEQKTEVFMQMLIGTKDNVKGVISFECCNKEKKLSENLFHYVGIVANLMKTIIEEKN